MFSGASVVVVAAPSINSRRFRNQSLFFEHFEHILRIIHRTYFSNLFAKSKIRQFQMPPRIQQHVIRLDITMDVS